MTLEEKVDELRDLLRCLVQDQQPQITFSEICRNLGFSKRGTVNWINRHAIKRVGRGRYCRVAYLEAARKRAA